MDFDFNLYSCIGILGGTFNPIHTGHLLLCDEAYEEYDDIEKIVFIPNNSTAYKDNSEIADINHRINMIKLAINNREYAAISDIDIKRGGITYTIDTLKDIKKINPDIKIYFIIGADSLYSFKKWYHYDEILELCTLLVALRDTDYEHMYEYINTELSVFADKIKLIHCEKLAVSSSEIRNNVKAGIYKDVNIPEPVIDYIKDNKLYI